MINTLDDYIPRSVPRGVPFQTNPNLESKVDPAGRILPFRGNTTVFLLDEATKEQLQAVQDSLYRAAPEMLAEPLEPDTFHMTLHDLANGRPGQWGLEEHMKYTAENASALLAQWKQEKPLRMKATWLFNMVNTSIVLGLAPADEDSRQRLGEMYTALEEVVRLGYALTPHITMAYFRPGWYGPEQVERLADALRPVELEVTLTADKLVLQEFDDMNHYRTVQ